MHPERFIKSSLILVLALTIRNEAVQAQAGAVRVFGWDLSETVGSLEALDANQASVRDEDGSSSNIMSSDIAFMEFIGSLSASARSKAIEPGMLILNDGTRFTGWPESTSDELLWLNWWCGTVEPDTDQIVSINRFDTKQPDTATSDDIVRLRNKDRVTGLVMGIGSIVTIDTSESTTLEIPIDRIDSIALVNPVRESAGTIMWLPPGDKVRIEEYLYGPGTGLMTSGREPLQPGNILAIAPDANRIVPLSSCDSAVETLDDMIRYQLPEPEISSGNWSLDAAPIEIRGPLRVVWNLPERDMGFVATMTIPHQYRRLGSVDIVIRDGSRSVLEHTLDARNPSVDVAVNIRSDRLVMELDEGKSGPLQDVVRVDRGLLLRSSP